MKCLMSTCISKLDNGDCRFAECSYQRGMMFSLSAWSRANVPKDPARFKVGEEVQFSIATTITKVYTDCDGTTLYTLDMVGNGWGEDTLSEVKGESHES